jgi:dTDP-4-dehydrorhamnose 3,5-epimerase
MIFTETPLKGAFILDLEPHTDSRGFFARAFCANEFAAHGLNTSVAQSSLSWSRRRGTLRGMHFSVPPGAEAKLVRCIRGAIHDVIIDLRPESWTYRRHYAVELTAESRRALYIPEQFAQGFQTLTDDTEVYYQMSTFYDPACQRGVRYDDPAFGIAWPLPVTEISEKDRSWPLLR